MSRKLKKTYIIKKVAGPSPVPEAPRVAEPSAKTWSHPDNVFRIMSLSITGLGLITTLILSRDQLFTSKEERQAMQREAIRLELIERERVERELEKQEQLERERIEKEKQEQERIAAEKKKQEEQRLALLKEKEETKKTTRKKRRKKDPIGDFFRKTFK